MRTYILKRLLLMIPTLFGITLIVWLLMVAAPGRPGEKAQAFGTDASLGSDPTKEREKGESQRLFRRQFALDRPVFWNGWTSLSVDEIRDTVRTWASEDSSIKVKREAKEKLEDWGNYAVPALVGILTTTEGKAQDDVLYWLRMSSYRAPVKAYGRDLDPEQVAQNDAYRAENVELATWTWKEGAPASDREPVVQKWTAWFEEHQDRWDKTFFERMKVGVTDTQFATYWGNVFQFNLGVSHVHKRPVIELILERLPVTLTISSLAILIAYVLAIPLGILSAVRPYTVGDRITTVFLFLLYSLPSFFVGTVLLRFFTVGDPFDWFPNSGFHSEGYASLNTWDRLKDTLWHITLPLAVMSYGGLAALSRYARSGMLDVIRSDYIRTARAKGLSEGAVIFRHAARNGMMPVVTLLGTILPTLIAGSVIVEYIFNLKGMGLLVIEAISNRDYNIVAGEILIVAALTLVGLLISDILYAVLDPRISYFVSAASSQSAAAARTSVSYWSVVGSQLKKNRIAMGAARTVAALVALAVGAPLLAMNAPLVALDETGFHVPLLTPEGMGVHAPLLDTLFNRDMYPSGVDVFFNLLLIVGGMWFVGARVPAALRRLKEEGLRALVKPRSRVADGMALTAAGLLVVLGFLPEGSGGWFVTLLRAVAWITLLPALPWAGPIALIFTGAWIVIAGPAFLGWLLIALAFPTMTGVVLLAYLVFGAATGALLGTWTLAWLLLPGLVGGLVWVYSARRPGEAPGDLRRSERLRWARWISLALFLITFVVLLRSHQTRPVVDWTKTLATTEATGVMPPIPYHPDNVGEQGLGPAERSRQRPSRDHVLGCDLNGRDVAARLIFGTRISLTIGLVAVSLYVTIGVILGSLAGYYGGWVDILISRAVEVMICFPVLFLLLTIVAVFDTRSIFLIMAGIGIVGWPTVARLVRGEFLRQRNLDYVTAAQAQGLPEWRVIFGHVLPNCVGPVLVSATFGIAAAILTESGLAFLGLGDTTAASWGQMLKDGRDSGLWHMIFSPGFAIFFVVTVFNLLGEGLRDALDPKLRR